MVIKINGVTINKVVKNSLVMRDRGDEIHDSGSFRLSKVTRREIYEPYTPVQIDVENKTFWWLIDAPESVRQSKELATYGHTIPLIEVTKILENITLPNMTDFQPLSGDKKTLKDQFLRLTDLFLPSYITIDSAMLDELDKVEGYQFQYTSPTLLEALNEVLSPMDWTVRMTDLSTLSYDDLNRKGNKITVTGWNHDSEYTDSNAYCTGFEADIKNAIVENGANGINKTYKLRKSRFIASDGYLMTDQNYKAVMDRAIYKTLYCKLFVILEDNLGNEELLTFDVSDYIYDERSWRLLKPNQVTFGVKSKIRTVYYQEGSKEIVGWGEQYLGLPALMYMIENIYWEENGGAFLFDNYKRSSFDHNKILYDLDFVSVGDVKINVERTNLSDFSTKRTIFYNQSDNMIDVNKFGSNIYNALNRTGNPERRLQRRFSSIDEIPVRGDYLDDNYILSVGETQVKNGYYIFNGIFVKNLNRKDQRIGVSSVKRIYDVPLESSQDRKQVFKTYIIASLAPISDDSSSILTTDRLKDAILDTFRSSFSSPKGIKNMIIKTFFKIGSSENLSLDANVVYSGRSIIVTGEFKDNYSAGSYIGDSITGGDEVLDAPYCDSNGEFESITIALYSDLKDVDEDLASIQSQLSKSKEYPIIQSTELDLTKLLFSHQTISMKKDRGERVCVGQQFEFFTDLSYQDRIVWGAKAISNNGLLFREFTVPNDLVVYTSSQVYGENDFKRIKTGSFATNVGINVGSNYIEIDSSLDTANSWAIGDSNGELYMAFNQLVGGSLDPQEKIYIGVKESR